MALTLGNDKSTRGRRREQPGGLREQVSGIGSMAVIRLVGDRLRVRESILFLRRFKLDLDYVVGGRVGDSCRVGDRFGSGCSYIGCW